MVSQSFQPFILVIEPSVTLRTVLVTELKRNGFVLVRAYDHPLKALKAMTQKRIPVPDIALICLQMHQPNGMAIRPDGIEVVEILRKKAYLTKIIVLLPYDSVLDRVKALLAGAQATVAKPWRVQTILAAISEVSSCISSQNQDKTEI